MGSADPHEAAGRLATESLAAGDATGWFDRLYAAAARDGFAPPWDRGAPHPLLVEWTRERGLSGAGRRALVVGCGLGEDAEHLVGLGFQTVAFDISAEAVRAARRRFPGSAVDHVVADVLDPPRAWPGTFDLVVEIYTVQALPDPPRRAAIERIASMPAPGGTLLVVATAPAPGDAPADGPPWPLTRAEVESFAAGGLELVRVEEAQVGGSPRPDCWRAELRRPAATAAADGGR